MKLLCTVSDCGSHCCRRMLFDKIENSSSRRTHRERERGRVLVLVTWGKGKCSLLHDASGGGRWWMGVVVEGKGEGLWGGVWVCAVVAPHRRKEGCESVVRGS